MLQVKTYLAKSSIEGIGVFAGENIAKGTVTWRYDRDVDIQFDPEMLTKFPQKKKELILRYAYLSKHLGVYIFPIDDSRFINHSSNPNTDPILMPGDTETCGVANRDINKGEEITINYRAIDSHDAISTQEYLDS